MQAIAYELQQRPRISDASAARRSTHESHQGLRGRLLAEAPLPRARPPDARSRVRRGLRVPRSQRRRQDHDAEAADAARVSDVGPGRDPRPAARRHLREAAHRLPSGESVFLRLPDGRGAAFLLRRRCSAIAAPSGGPARAGCSTRSASAPNAGCSSASFPKGCCSASASRRRSSTIPSWSIFDEPMSGLDPLGRRDVRALILRLRDRGCTVFFSSHVLSDAEALCSRVAILAKGRLVAAGRLTDMLAFQARGWELVVSGVERTGDRRARARGSAASVRIGEGRYTLELPLESAPDRVAGGADGRRRAARVPQSDSRHARGLLRPAGHAPRRSRPRTGRPRSVMRPSLIAVNVFRESVRDKVLYNLVAVRDPADRRVVSDRPAHRRPGRQDHQGSRPGGDVDLRPVHRGLHRHRARVEGSGAPEHLQPARQADPALPARARQVLPGWC